MAAPVTAEPPAPVIEELLADDRRRRLLEILRERGEPMVVDDLAAAVCAAEAGPRGTVEEDDRWEVRAEIFERHLPKLTAIDAVTYDSMVGTVEYVGAGELCDRLER